MTLSGIKPPETVRAGITGKKPETRIMKSAETAEITDLRSVQESRKIGAGTSVRKRRARIFARKTSVSRKKYGLKLPVFTL
jgi:hypothetical protein